MHAVIVDYGAGNLRSVERALERVGFVTRRTEHPEALWGAELVVLPGVGAFGPAADRLRARGFFDAIREALREGRWLLGLCLGMQMLFEESEEDGFHRGLGLLPGRVVRLPRERKVPHMGWNALHFAQPTPLCTSISDGAYVYFVHSYYALARPSDVLAWTEYGVPIPAIVGRDRILGFQFHPEKSSRVGLRLLAGVYDLVRS